MGIRVEAGLAAYQSASGSTQACSGALQDARPCRVAPTALPAHNERFTERPLNFSERVRGYKIAACVCVMTAS